MGAGKRAVSWTKQMCVGSPGPGLLRVPTQTAWSSDKAMGSHGALLLIPTRGRLPRHETEQGKYTGP